MSFDVTIILKFGKSVIEPVAVVVPGIGCAISIDGCNTLIYKLSPFARMSRAAIKIKLNFRRCTVKDPLK